MYALKSSALSLVLIAICLPLRANPEIGTLESTTGIGSIFYSCEAHSPGGNLGLSCEFSQTTVNSYKQEEGRAASFMKELKNSRSKDSSLLRDELGCDSIAGKSQKELRETVIATGLVNTLQIAHGVRLLTALQSICNGTQSDTEIERAAQSFLEFQESTCKVTSSKFKKDFIPASFDKDGQPSIWINESATIYSCGFKTIISLHRLSTLDYEKKPQWSLEIAETQLWPNKTNDKDRSACARPLRKNVYRSGAHSFLSACKSLEISNPQFWPDYTK